MVQPNDRFRKGDTAKLDPFWNRVSSMHHIPEIVTVDAVRQRMGQQQVRVIETSGRVRWLDASWLKRE